VREAARIFADFVTLAGVAVIKLANLPHSKGYEPYLIEAGITSIAARGLAAISPRRSPIAARPIAAARCMRPKNADLR
jgi:hypothetical protein